MMRLSKLIESGSEALSAQLASFAADLNERTASVEQQRYYRGYEDGFNDCRDPILCITPEDVAAARMEANTYVESEDEYIVRWLRSLVLKEALRDSPQQIRE
jgi:hypothetical protein